MGFKDVGCGVTRIIMDHQNVCPTVYLEIDKNHRAE
jgi:hypothetical protein